MANKPLTERELLFLEYLFEEGPEGNPKQAAIRAGYSKTTDVYEILNRLVHDVIRRKADAMILYYVSESIKTIIKVMQDPTEPGAPMALKAAESLLDRAGFSRKDKLEVEHQAPNGIIIIPPKNKDEE